MTPPRNTTSDRRPLTARSVVASTLLGVDPPRLPTSSLVRTATLFGLAEGTVRVAMSRMLAKGEVSTDGDGYRLAGHLVERQHRQQQSRHAATRPWDGTWELAVVADVGRPAPERSELRRALVDLRMGELHPGTWGRPDNLDPTRLPGAAAVRDARCHVLRGARPAARSQPTDHDRLWDLGAWTDDARSLLAEMAALRPTLDGDRPDGLAPAFECAAAVLRHLQADPLLPAALLGDEWPGTALRASYERFEAAFQTTLRSWLTSAG